MLTDERELVMEKACCYTGHRPEKLGAGLEEGSKGLELLKQRLFCETLRLTREGVGLFLVGMARGADLWAAEQVLSIRNVRPEGTVKLWACIPYDRQSAAWSDKDRALYEQILSRADKVTHISHEYTRACLHERNRFMVDNSSHMIAVYNGASGGTRNTIEYARKKGLDITVINPDELTCQK